MVYECGSGVADDCVGTGAFNAAYEDDDGSPVCIMCAIELGLDTP